nr:protein kinase [Thermoanaerobaculales bacterium]
MSEVDATDPGPTAAERRGHGTSTGARPGDTLGGRFLLRQVLGYGGTGTVFAALDTVVGQKVAVKLLHPDLHDATTRERLRREVRAARHGHPNLVAVYDLHEDAEHVWLSMELVEGESLKQRLAERRRLEPDEVTGIGRQIAAALAHLHGLGLVHRDLKPGNILLGADASARLCDMGLTRPIEQGTTLTLTEMVVGTPAYMAPEQGLGRGLTAASDVYGLGMTLYQALTGTVPLTSETAVATLTRRQREAPPPLLRARPDAPRWLGRLLARMLEPRPGDRPTAAAVRRALETRRMWPRPRRRTLVAGAAAAALITAVAVAAPLLLQRETVRFEVGGTTVHGLDRDGRRTWSHELPAPMTMSLEADLDGDGRAELVASGRPAPEDFRSLQPSRSFVDVVTLRGRLLTRMVPEEMVPLWSFPYRVDLMPLVRAFDLDGDGREELVASCQHIHFFPTVVIVYWPRWDRWEIALNHPGHLSAIAPGTGDGSPGLRVFGINNDLGHTPVYGEIALLPPGPRLREGSFSVGLGSPPEGRLGSSSSASWQVYVPLDEAVRGVGRPADRIVSRPDGFLELGQGAGDGFRLDRFFNPVPGPNAGRDLRAQRLAFMDGLYLIAGAGSAIRPAGVRERLDRAARAAGPLLDEAPYRLILAVVGARALATA